MPPSDPPPANRAKTSADESIGPDVEDLTFAHPRNDIVLRPGPALPNSADSRRRVPVVPGEQDQGEVAALLPGRTVFPFRSSILANSIDIFESMFADASPSKGKVVPLEDTDPDTLRTFLHLLSPSITHPITATLSSLPYSSLLPLFRLAHKLDADWVCAEIEYKLAFTRPPHQSDVFTLFETAFFMTPQPMYALAGKTLIYLPRPFQISTLPKPLRMRLAREAPEFLIAAQEFYDAAPRNPKPETDPVGSGIGSGVAPPRRQSTMQTSANVEGWLYGWQGYNEDREERVAREMGGGQVGKPRTWAVNTSTMFEESGLDNREMLYWKGSKGGSVKKKGRQR